MNRIAFPNAFSDQIEIAGTITKLSPNAAGKVIVSASHGGELPGGLALRAGARAVIFNDAGVGLEQAGIGSLILGQTYGMAAATVSCMSCRIGDADDMVARGRISHANELARSVGVYMGQSCRQAAEMLTHAPLSNAARDAPEFTEYRETIDLPGSTRKLILVDSASMIAPGDAGQVVLTGSHGGLIGGNPKFAVKAAVYAAFFSDAGGGIDDGGMSRLPALDDREIAGVVLDCMSCRIGDARSGLSTGRVSHVNRRARSLSLTKGMVAMQAVKKLCG